MCIRDSPYVLRFNRKTRVWRRHNERYKVFATKATVKHDVKINVWGCFASHGVGNLYEVEGILNKHQYKEILINQMMPSGRRLFDTDDWYFHQDNDPKHTAKTTKTWFRRNRTPLFLPNHPIWTRSRISGATWITSWKIESLRTRQSCSKYSRRPGMLFLSIY